MQVFYYDENNLKTRIPHNRKVVNMSVPTQQERKASQTGYYTFSLRRHLSDRCFYLPIYIFVYLRLFIQSVQIKDYKLLTKPPSNIVQFFPSKKLYYE